MMKDVLEITPTTKEEGLKEFAPRGYFLIDATYTPVNQMADKDREWTILHDSSALVEELGQYAKPGIGIVLVKAKMFANFSKTNFAKRASTSSTAEG